MDQTLASCGRRRLIERGAVDAAGDVFGTFEAWKEELFRALRKEIPGQNVISKERLSIELVNASGSLGQITDAGIISTNKILVPPSETSPTIRHLEINLPKGQTYRAGDYFAVLLTNPMEIVYRDILAHCSSAQCLRCSQWLCRIGSTDYVRMTVNEKNFFNSRKKPTRKRFLLDE